MAKILVTGGAGYIGSHCCKALAAAGHQPVVYDNFSTGHRGFVKWGPVVEGDVRDGERLRQAIAEHRPHAAMHFAALALVGESVRDPGLYYEVNVGGTLQLLKALVGGGVPRLVFSSTCAIYGIPEKVPIGEDTPVNPINPYGVTKLTCERMMDDFDVAHGLRSIRLRYFNAAGADPDGEIGEWHEPESHLIPLVIEAALRGKPVGIFGSDYATPDGTAIRDYIHVADLAAAHLAAIELLLKGASSAAMNLGTGHGASVNEIIALVEKVGERKVPSYAAPRRAGDPDRLVANAAKAASLLSWKPRCELRTIIEDAWRWHRGRNVT